MKLKMLDFVLSMLFLFALHYFGGWGAALTGAVWSVWSYFDGCILKIRSKKS